MFTGALRLSSPGPIDHIEGMREEWGESAYLVVQMAGTQAGLLGGATCLVVWIVTTSAIAWRRGGLPRWLAGLGFLPALVLVGAVLGPAGVELPDLVWLGYVAVLVVGLPVWLLGSAVTILSGKRSREPGSFEVAAGLAAYPRDTCAPPRSPARSSRCAS